MSTKITGLIGFPTSHSLSPRIHDYWIREHGLDVAYKLFTTPPPRLRQTMLHMRKKEVLGVNITIPHKQAVMDYLDEVDEEARRMGAVNTVVNRKGKFIGTNTDAYGFITNLKEGLGDVKPYLQHAVILGAGGATRAVIVALQDAGAKTITLSNRSADKAENLAQAFQVRHQPWERRNELLAGATLLVNTTSLGMEGHEPLEIDLALLHENAAVHDIVYAPFETPLLKKARERGHPTVDGLGMLLYQAQAAFMEWHGVEPAVTKALRDYVMEPPDAA